MAEHPTTHSSEFLAGLAQVFESLSSGAALTRSLELLTRVIQAQMPGVQCSVSLLEKDGKRLRTGAALDLPEEYSAALDGMTIGDECGSCGSAALNRRLVVSADIATDPLWGKWRELALAHGLRACWSRPILAAGGQVLGTFAMYHREAKGPEPTELEILQVAANLAGMAIERSHSDEAHARAETKCRAVFEYSLDPIFIVDDQGVCVDTNPAAAALIGGPAALLVGAHIDTFLKPDFRPGSPDHATRWANFLRDGRYSGDGVVHCIDGSRRHVSIRSRAHILPGFHLCVARDVTEQKFAEEAVRCAEELYSTLVETTHTGYVVADSEGCVLDANAEYVHLAGCETLDEIVGRHPMEWTAPRDRERLKEELGGCFRRGFVRDLEVEFLDRHGNVVPVEINATVVGTGPGMRLLTLCRDITGRLQTRRELESASRDLETRVQLRTFELAAASDQIRSRAHQQETVAELGRQALADCKMSVLFQDAAQATATILGVEFAVILEHADPASDDLVMRGSVGWPRCEYGSVVSSTDPELAHGYALRAGAPVLFEDLAAEKRFKPVVGMLEAGVVSGITVSIRNEHGPFGLVAARCKRRRKFSADDAHFLQSIANVLAAAIERKRGEEIVRLAQQGAVQANNAKIDFLSRMSHELRTPLNAILGFSQLLDIEDLSAGQRESVEQINRAGRHLLELVNEVLDISRIDSGNMALEPEPVEVEEILGEAVDLIRPLADARQVQLLVLKAIDKGARFVLADRQRLRQVILNLVSNAVKYNRTGGSVTLANGPAPDGKHVRISVADKGIGIRAELLPLLFTPFERLGAENSNVEGSGMGLALSKRLIEAQAGTLGVDSVAGAGSTFWIDLPVAAAPLPGSLPALFDELIHSHLFQEEAVTPLLESPRPEPPKVPRKPLDPSSQRVVLHIEDNEANQRLIQMLIARRPMLRLITASRGYEGLELAHRHHPDLILLDVHLPDTTGAKVLQDLRADEATRETPVVIVTADATLTRFEQMNAIGASSYLLKPFKVGQFLKIIDEFLLVDAA